MILTVLGLLLNVRIFRVSGLIVAALFILVSRAGVGAYVRVSLSAMTVLSLEDWSGFIAHDVKMSTTIFFISQINGFITRFIYHKPLIDQRFKCMPTKNSQNQHIPSNKFDVGVNCNRIQRSYLTTVKLQKYAFLTSNHALFVDLTFEKRYISLITK
jgi:hypothetical protein